MTRFPPSLIAALLWPALLSCGQNDFPEISATISTLSGRGIPEIADCLEIAVHTGGDFQSRSLTVQGLMDRDGNMRPESIIGSAELPEYGIDFEIRITARSALNGCGAELPGQPSYMGSTGPIRLRAGERRVVKIVLYEIGATEFLTLGDELPPRFLHTSTPLGDGRVLIAGGFTSLAVMDCPADVDAEQCYLAQASNDAYIFDTPTGSFLPVAEGMLVARGGHTATLLTDGRVFVAGGAETALIAMTSGERPALELLPLQGRLPKAHASFEFFSRGLQNPSDDPLRQGFPGRGLFEGPSSNPTNVGALNHERFLHGAASVDGLQVLLAGGTGGGTPSSSYEVFDLVRPGGEGVDNQVGTLQTPRPMPTAFVLNGSVWIYGGGTGASDLDLAEVWDGEVPGRTLPATDQGFNLSEEPHPELALIRPQAVPNAAGDKVLVTGWYGPLCDASADDREHAVYMGAEEQDLHRCNEPPAVEGTRQRNFFLSDSVSAYQPSNNQNQAFASAVRLDNPDSALILGGMRRDFATRMEVLGYRYDTESFVGRSELRAQRAMHASSVIPGDQEQILTTGGLFNAEGTLVLTPTAAEMMTLTRGGGLPAP